MICFLGFVVMFVTQVRHHEEHEQQTNNLILDNTELLNALYELPLPKTQLELEEINDELKELHPLYILQWAYHATHMQNELISEHPLVQVTSFGLTGIVILDLILTQLHLKDVPIITMDTLHLFPESYGFYETIISNRKDMNLIITKPLGINTKTDFQTKYGSSLWKTDPKKFTQLTKIDPLNKQLDDMNVQMWISGRRRTQGGERAHIPVLEFEFFSEEDIDENNDFNESLGRWKLNPLAYWSYDQVWEYIKTNKLSYNNLYDKGYTSIGDTMTTTLPRFNATTSGSQNGDGYERSGRFVGMNKTECGLHSVRAKRQQAKVDDGEESTAPSLVCDKCIDTNTDNFVEVISSGKKEQEVLLEFYSPYCGGCQAFAPTLNRIANHLSPNSRNSVVRFDITEHDIPQIDGKDVFKVETTPTLYRVSYSPSFQVEFYTGDHDFDSIIDWFRN